jgi:hypothetical protein
MKSIQIPFRDRVEILKNETSLSLSLSLSVLGFVTLNGESSDVPKFKNSKYGVSSLVTVGRRRVGNP